MTYVMVGVLHTTNANKKVQILAKGDLEHCKDFQLSSEEEFMYEEFLIYTLEDFCEIANKETLQ